jgi:hypothetical protein
MSACINMNEPKDQADFINARNKFDTLMTFHIPPKLPNNQCGYGFCPPSNEIEKYCGIYIDLKHSSIVELESIKNKYKERAKAIVNSNDSCIAVVETYGSFNKLNYKYAECKNFIPVPQYLIFSYDGSSQTWIRKKDIELLILNCQSGDYLKRKDLKPLGNMPAKWGNGFSAGIAFNRSDLTTTNWLIIW